LYYGSNLLKELLFTNFNADLASWLILYNNSERLHAAVILDTKEQILPQTKASSPHKVDWLEPTSKFLQEVNFT